METSFEPICPKTLCSLSPTPMMLHIKFDQDWPTGFRDIQVWKCGRRQTTTTDDDDGRTDDGPLVYYKLTLLAFSSGELKMGKILRTLRIGKILRPRRMRKILRTRIGKILRPLRMGKILRTLSMGKILRTLSMGKILRPLRMAKILRTLRMGKILSYTENGKNIEDTEILKLRNFSQMLIKALRARGFEERGEWETVNT